MGNALSRGDAMQFLKSLKLPAGIVRDLIDKIQRSRAAPAFLLTEVQGPEAEQVQSALTSRLGRPLKSRDGTFFSWPTHEMCVMMAYHETGAWENLWTVTLGTRFEKTLLSNLSPTTTADQFMKLEAQTRLQVQAAGDKVVGEITKSIKALSGARSDLDAVMRSLDKGDHRSELIRREIVRLGDTMENLSNITKS